ncbi:Vps16, C-terminal region-domain-containing protein [Mrakia frigida]|uniref:tethering complex subunit VPS16 n=1 Tax=Mrakia frigida TaxID=29902 RepID=UPI003FCC217D
MNPLSDAATDWQTLDTTFYRNLSLYDLPWTVKNLDHHFVAVDKNGGSIALLRNPSIPTPYTTTSSSISSPTIFIYTSSGLPIVQIAISQASSSSSASSSASFNSPLIFSYLPSTSQLLLLADDGSYRLYAPNSATYETFQIGGQVAAEGIDQGKCYEGGMIVRTNAGNWWDVPIEIGGGGSRRAPRKLADVVWPEGGGGDKKIATWMVMDPSKTQTRMVLVVISVGGTLLTLDEGECIDQRLSKGPFLSLHPSPSGRLLALLLPSASTSTGPSLWVVSSDFQTNHATIPYASLLGNDSAEDSNGNKTPDRVEWCGNDALGVAWSGKTPEESRVVICGPGGQSLTYPQSSAVELVSEVDGLRIISSRTCSFVQKVPSPLLSLLLPGSSHPPSLLLYAYTLFLSSSPKSSSLLQTLRPDLSLAVLGCLEAASELWEPEQQKFLLKAAVYGRAFLEGEGDSGVVERGKGLKVVNCLRGWEVGMGISWEEYTRLPPTHLLTLLTSRNLHLLSLRIATHLSLDPDPILEHWACAKIAKAAGREDADVCREIVGKLSGGKRGEGRGRYAGIARKAWGVGRRGLATLLLDHEPRLADQVPLLLSMKEDRLALDKAIASGDTDLVYHVLLHLKTHLALGDFFRIVDDRPRAAALLEIYAKEQDREMLKDFYYQDDRREESARLMLEEADRAKDVTERLAAIKAASKFFGEDKDRAFESKMMDDSYRLLSLQQALEKEAEDRISLVGLSINDTIRTCIEAGLPKKAERVRGDFKVPDKRFYYIKLQALTNVQDWPSLDSFAKSRRSPIGYEPFVNHLVSKGYLKEAARYVPRCETKHRIDLWVKCEDWSQAAAECKERGDKTRLEQLSKTAPTTLVKREFDAVLSSMNR